MIYEYLAILILFIAAPILAYPMAKLLIADYTSSGRVLKTTSLILLLIVLISLSVYSPNPLVIFFALLIGCLLLYYSLSYIELSDFDV